MNTKTANQSSLDDLMVAMDVVDTLRHRQGLVDRELDADNRRQRLIQKLRDIYRAQGIDVTDAILEEGVEALEQERFSYQAPDNSFSVRLAKLYVSRTKWLKPLMIVIGLLMLIWILRLFLVVYPEWQALDKLPAQIGKTYSDIQKLSSDAGVTRQAKQLVDNAAVALNAEELNKAKGLYQQLTLIKQDLQQSYRIRVVSRPGQMSGLWRIPDANPNARNYYLIVEAIDSQGNTVKVNILNEENNKTVSTDIWGIRVDQSVFQAVAADKKDDGIIQRNIVGEKVLGELKPRYLIQTTGAAITRW